MNAKSRLQPVFVMSATLAILTMGRANLLAQPPAPPPGEGDGNRAPHADAGPNQRLGLYPGRFVTITLDGSKSFDPDFDVITYVWRNNSTGSVLSTGKIASDIVSSVGQYSYTLTVTDEHNASASATATIEVVQDVLPPLITAPDITVGKTEDGGARGSGSSALAAYLSGGKTSAIDNVDAHPTFVSVKVGQTVADNQTFFPLGQTTIEVSYQDTAGNIGSAQAIVGVVDHQDNDVFVVSDGPSGHIIINRVRGSAVESFCSPLQYVPFSDGVPVIVDSQGRVVFLGYIGDSVGLSWGLFRCSTPGAPPEAIAQFRNGDIILDPSIPEPFPGVHFTNIGALHLESVRSVALHGDTVEVITEDAYVMAARPEPGGHVEAIRYRVKTGVWEDGRTVPEPMQGGPGCCGNNALPPMVSHGGAVYSTDGRTIRRTSIPLQVDISGTIHGIGNFELTLSLFGGAKEIPQFLGGTIIDDLKVPNVDSGCQAPAGSQASTSMPFDGPFFHVFSGVSGILYDEFNGHALIGISNSGGTFGPVATIGQEYIDDDPSNDRNGAFTDPYLGCSVVVPVLTDPLLPPSDPTTGAPNPAPPLAAAPNGLYGVVGRRPIQVVMLEPGARFVPTATLPYPGLPSSIAAFPAATPAPSGTQIYIEVESPVDVLATDVVSGKRIGVLNGEAVNDYGADGFDSGPGEPRVFVIRNPAAGRFAVQIVGTGDGPFTVHVYSVDLDKPFGRHVKVSGTAFPGSTASLDFDLANDGSVAFVDLAPVANAGADQTVDADATGVASVTLDGSQSTDPDGDALTFTWAGPFGSASGPRPQVTLPVGVHVVALTVGDGKGASALATVTITVNGSKKTDQTPPVLALPPGLTVEATGGDGATAMFVPTANDAVDGSRPVSCVPASGSLFALGTTTVTCTASDRSGNVATGSFAVVVRDTTPPVLTLPASFTLEASGPAGAEATFNATATDVVAGSRLVACVPASGSTFPLGTTIVTCSASDASGNTASGSFAVTVRDTMAPSMSCAASPSVLWPPNGRLVPITVNVDIEDGGSGPAGFVLTDVRSSEDDPATIQGFVIGTPAAAGALVASRRGNGPGRVYTLTYTGRDRAGNAASCHATVTVPHDRR